MSVATVFTRAHIGIDAPRIRVETHLSNGLPAFNIVGLAQTTVKESKDRVRSALLNSSFDFPMRRITVNLGPADIPKLGGRYDLAIALGILLASEQLPAEKLNHCEFYGELGLNGELRRVNGLVPALLQGDKARQTLFVPSSNTKEAGLFSQAEIFSASHLLEICAHLNGHHALLPTPHTSFSNTSSSLDFSEVKGQQGAKRALEIAAAGKHNVLMSGPPGTGKTMLASRMPGILPPLSEQQALKVAAIASSTLGISNDDTGFLEAENGAKRETSLSLSPPFRAPHHSCSTAALIGGGSLAAPGEISLAHNGVLFLDELPEFPRNAIEALREPLEYGVIRIARAKARFTYPAKFLLLAARNLCPCGYFNDGSSRCRCTPDQIDRYQQKISGPMMDRIDIHIHLQRNNTHALAQSTHVEESSQQILQRVEQARQLQLNRSNKLNAELSPQQTQQYCHLGSEQNQAMQQASESLQLSLRAYHRVLRVARTIADLNGEVEINTEALMEALSYRSTLIG